MNRKDPPIDVTLAPHVDPSWVKNLMLELRLLGVSGQAVGAALSEVEAHVVDSGQDAQDAFGDPAAYARGLALPVAPDQTTEATLLLGAPVLAQVLGLVIFAPMSGSTVGTVAWSWGFLVGTAVLITAIVALFAWSGSILRAGLRKPVLAAIGASGVVLATPLLVIAFPVTAFFTPSWVGWFLGASLLTAGTLVMLVRKSSGEDPIVGPYATSVASGTLAGVFGALAVPAAAVLLVAVGYAMGPGVRG